MIGMNFPDVLHFGADVYLILSDGWKPFETRYAQTSQRFQSTIRQNFN